MDSERAEAACIGSVGAVQSLPGRKKRKKPGKIQRKLGYWKIGTRLQDVSNEVALICPEYVSH